MRKGKKKKRRSKRKKNKKKITAMDIDKSIRKPTAPPSKIIPNKKKQYKRKKEKEKIKEILKEVS